MASTANEVTEAAPRSARERVLAELERLALSANVVELETNGYTVIPGVLSSSQIERARDAIVARVERESGHTVDLQGESGEAFAGQVYVPYLLYDDPIFEEIVLAERPLALITYLLGESALLSSIGCHFKGPGGHPLPLHSDNGNGMPGPFPAYSQVANVNYALTPYSREAGALAMVPGSHKLARQPRPEETVLHGEHPNPKAVAMDLAPGDAVVWHGNTWHGSFARQLPGVRMNLAVYFCRQYLQTQENHRSSGAAAMLEGKDEDSRLRVLLGAKQPYGWQESGPDYQLMARNPRGLYD